MSVVLRTRDAKHEGADFGSTLAQITGSNGGFIQQADVEEVILNIFDPQVNGNDPFYSATIQPADVIFDTPQTGSIWNQDTVGYNFKHYLSRDDVFAAYVEQGVRTYRLEYQIKTGFSGTLYVIREVYNWPTKTTTTALDFSISVSPSSANGNIGDNLAFTVTVGAINGFAAPVTLSASPPVTGLTYSFGTNPLNPGSNTTLHVLVGNSVVGGNYPITITGTAGSIVHTAQIGIDISHPDFTISTNILSSAIAVGATKDITVTVSAGTGFTGQVALAASAFPAMNGAVFNFDALSLTPTASTTLHVTNTGGVAINLYSLIITGTQGTLSHSTYVNMQVGTKPGTGWTNPSVSNDTRIVYVSTSGGNDANDGLSQLTPKSSLGGGVGLLRTGFPDWILLKKGDFWDGQNFGNWSRAGRSISEPMVLSSYGSGTTRPLLGINFNVPFGGVGIYNHTPTDPNGAPPANHISIIGLEFWANGHHTQINSGNPVAIMWFGATQNLLVEDCRIREFSTGIIVQGTEDPIHHVNFKVRRCVIHDQWSLDPSSCHGIYSDFIDGWTVEGNVFDRNGYGFDGPLTGVFQQAHQLYVNSNATSVTLKDNVLARNAGFDTIRPGGVVNNNLMVRTTIALRLGSHGFDNVALPAGITVEARGNVILDGNDFSADPNDARGWGIALDNVSSGIIDGNVIAHNRFGHGPTPINYRRNDLTGRVAANLIFSGNVVYDWQSINSPPDPSTTAALEGFTAEAALFTGNTFVNNILMQPRVSGLGADTLLSFATSTFIDPAKFTGHGNKYFSMRGGNGDFSLDALTLGWFNSGAPPGGGNTYTVNSFRAAMGDPNSGSASIPELHAFPAGTVVPGGSAALDNVDLEHYMSSIGLSPTLDAFLFGNSVRNPNGTITGTTGARSQSRDLGYFDTETRFTSTAVNTYIRAGFGVSYTP
jgi:hypothetical protein